MTSLKGPGEPQRHDGKFAAGSISPFSLSQVLILLGSELRIAIVHARWNAPIIAALVAGARKTLSAAGVLEDNIVVFDVPGSYELPFAVQRCRNPGHWVSLIPPSYRFADPSVLPSLRH